MCYRTGKYTVCRRIRASFSPKVSHAGAVKGLKKCQQMLSHQWYVSVSDHLCGPHHFHKDTGDSMSVWVVIWVDFTSFTRTPVTGVGSTLCQCECLLEWILPLSQGHQRLVLGQQYVSVSAHRSGFYLFHKDTSDCCSTIHGSQVKRGPVFNPSWDGGQELAAANQHLHHSAQTSISTVISIHKDMYCWWPLSICTYLQQHGKCMRY